MNIKSVPKKQLWGIELNLISLLFSSISPVLNKFSLTSLSPVVGGIFTSAFAAIFTFATILITRRHVSLTNLKSNNCYPYRSDVFSLCFLPILYLLKGKDYKVGLLSNYSLYSRFFLYFRKPTSI